MVYCFAQRTLTLRRKVAQKQHSTSLTVLWLPSHYAFVPAWEEGGLACLRFLEPKLNKLANTTKTQVTQKSDWSSKSAVWYLLKFVYLIQKPEPHTSWNSPVRNKKKQKKKHTHVHTRMHTCVVQAYTQAASNKEAHKPLRPERLTFTDKTKTQTKRHPVSWKTTPLDPSLLGAITKHINKRTLTHTHTHNL